MKHTFYFSILLLALVACSPKQDEAAAGGNQGVITMQEGNSPFVAMNVWIKVGSQNDPKGKEGLASITANLLENSSTTNNSYEQILEKLYPLAASYSLRVDKEMTVLQGRVHKDNLDAFYALFKDALLAPAFKEEDFTRIKEQSLSYLEQTRRYSSDEELGKELLFRQIYKGTPYEHPEEGYVASMKSITLDDVKAFYQAHYLRNNLVVAAGGGFPAGFPERMRKDFDVLPEGVVQEVPKPQPAPIEGNHAIIVEKDTKATAMSFGYPIDLTRADSDFYAMMTANSWFGEHRSGASHLYDVIRSVRGMNYGDYSYIEAYPGGHTTQIPPTNVSRRSQIFQIWIRPISMLKPGDMHSRSLFALRAAMREHEKLLDDGLSQEGFDSARGFLHNYTTNFGATVSRRLAYRVDDAFYGIEGDGHLAMIRPELAKLTVETVNQAIHKHLHKKGMWFVFITEDAEALKTMLVEGPPSPIKYNGEVDQSVLDEDQIIQQFPVPFQAENIQIMDINEVFEQ